MQNKILLITGGTGSFGQAVLKRVIGTKEFDEIRVFSRDEKKQDDLRKTINSNNVKFFIGDVRDKKSLLPAVKGADCIFHAAALKQVPSCEFFPMEAVKTNIFGTENVLALADLYEVKKTVVLSTDKAAYPINAMGMTKAIMEKVMVAKSRVLNTERSVFSATRYGNVIGSRGSVIPLFINQIKTNQPITITNPEMTRFLMSLDDAVNLVFYAFQNAQQGDLFVQKSPASTIKIVAQALIEIYGSKSKIKYIGTRHGEKLYETLISKEDMVYAEDLGDYFRVPADNRSLNYEVFYTQGNTFLNKSKDYHSHNTTQLTLKEVIELLMKLPLIRKDILGETYKT